LWIVILFALAVERRDVQLGAKVTVWPIEIAIADSVDCAYGGSIKILPCWRGLRG